MNPIRAASQSALACVMNCGLVSGLVPLAATLVPAAMIPNATTKPTTTTRRTIINLPALYALRNVVDSTRSRV